MDEVVKFRKQILSSPLVRDVWSRKYRLWENGVSPEDTVFDTQSRVVNGVYWNDTNHIARADALRLVSAGILVPGGRVNAGAGLDRKISLLNCFVLPTVPDHMPGIQKVIAQGSLTMQQGGGIGVDFSTIRPAGALVSRTGSIASGVIPFADQQDGMCKSIVSAGTRRGAMMLTLRDDHPDLYNPYQYETMTDYTGRTVLKHPSFISVKRQSGRLTQFNVSVLVSDAFLEAVETDSQWDLGFHIPLADGQHVAVYKKPFPYDLSEMDNEWQEISGGRTIKKGTLMPWYVYQRVKARKIWEEIMRSTYTYAEPGVIFIDRINERNNLNYCEEIRCVNPCGEQPLPPNGCCCLGSINTAFLVNDPFTDRAEFDFDMFEAAVEVGVRFLDNVLDVSNYPLEAQRLESMNKRRIGLGITGWADALLQLQLTYGSQASVNITREVARTLRDESYRASSELAIERGTFLHYDRHAIQQAWTVKRLPDELRERIHENGLRNGVLNTIAPNGTISLYIGNVSSGHEPVFSFEPTRRLVRQEDGSLREYPSIDYAQALFAHLYPAKEKPDYCVGALDLPVEAHLAIHAAWQDYIDASISKTINCAPDMAFGDFERVYWSAYQMGCKGVTTFRDDPASGRGTVLSLAGSAQGVAAAPSNAVVVPPRPTVLAGRTHKLKWPLTDTNWYVTITHDEDHVPRELFITTREVKHQEWVTALGRMVTAVLRRGGDISFLVGELIEVHSASGGVFLDEKYCPSVVAAIGRILEREFISLGIANPTESLYMHDASGEDDSEDGAETMHNSRRGKERCPQCNAPAWVNEGGCGRCLSCDFTTCG